MVYSIQRTHCLTILIWYVSFSLKSVIYLSCKYFHCSVHTSSCCPSCAHIDWIDSFLDQIQLHTWVISCILQSSELFFSLLESFCCNLSIRSCNACSVSIYRKKKHHNDKFPIVGCEFVKNYDCDYCSKNWIELIETKTKSVCIRPRSSWYDVRL